VQYSSNSGSTWTTFSHSASTSTSASVTGLTNNTAYVFRVAAVTIIGVGGFSSASSSVTPGGSVLNLSYTSGAWNGAGTSASPYTSSSVFGPVNNNTLPFSFTASADCDVSISIYQYNSTATDNHNKQQLYYRINGSQLAAAKPAPSGSSQTVTFLIRLLSGETLTLYPSGPSPYDQPTDLYSNISVYGTAASVANRFVVLSSSFSLTGTGTSSDPLAAPTPFAWTGDGAGGGPYVTLYALASGNGTISVINPNNNNDYNNNIFSYRNGNTATAYFNIPESASGQTPTQTQTKTVSRGDSFKFVMSYSNTVQNLQFWAS
jgi:hypothetical protein